MILRVMPDIATRVRSVPCGPCLAVALILCGFGGPAQALKVHNKYGSPLDTLMNTHITTDAPPAKDFVRATSPNKDSLDYTPLTGTDPTRPKPRTPSEVQALQAELEGAGARNEKRARGLLPRKSVPGLKTKAAKTAKPDKGVRVQTVTDTR